MPHTNLYFFTATILNWKHLLKPDKYKYIITDSLSFLVENNRVFVLGFVVMPNHIHIIWQIRNGHQKEEVQRDFLKYTSQKMKFDLIKNHPKVLEFFKVDLKDRKYQFWKYNSLSIELYTEAVIEQKLIYIHNNPIVNKWRLANLAEEYRFSSAAFYLQENKEWCFLTHYKEI